MPPKKRLSLVERQQALLEAEGFSKTAPPIPIPTPSSSSSSSYASLPSGFRERQEAHLLKHGQSNAAASSRIALDFSVDADDKDDDKDDGAKSVAYSTSSRYSHAPSIHPSLSGLSDASSACSTISIGAGDETAYWKYRHRVVTMKDLGHTCRECKCAFSTLGEPLTERRGARTSSRYHGECFSGFADPRSQAGGSMWSGKLAGTQLAAAPREKAVNKMRTSEHFTAPTRFGSKVVMGNFDFRDKDGGGVKNRSGMLQTLDEDDLDGLELPKDDLKQQVGTSGLNASLLALHDKKMAEEKT